jgi:hypothetical protein
MSFRELQSDCDQDPVTSKDSDVIWREGVLNIKPATPSIIRRGLCMVRNEGK